MLAEILEVLQRPELTRKFRSLELIDTRKIIAILGQAEVVEIAEIPATSRDAKDDKFLATTAAAIADYLVTEDRDMLVIGTYQGVRIVDTATFLNVIEQEEPGRP